MEYILTVCEFDRLYFVARQSSSNPQVYRNIAQCMSMEDAKFILDAFTGRIAEVVTDG